MPTDNWIQQSPAPGHRTIAFRGDTQTFRLELDRPRTGDAWVRTNIGYADISRQEIIREVHLEERPLGRDWFDTPMRRIGDRTFQVTLPLREVGHFEAKCYFWENGAARPLWPPGPNAVINVEPAQTCCANIIYNAFVRQFGPNKSGTFTSPLENHHIALLDRAGYAVIPASGKFRDLINELDFIIGELGCRFIQLLPIHPTPTTYGRMGRFGSPYAALSFTDVDPALAEFDPAATPLEQFVELVDAIHARGAGVLIDIAINHTGWAANLHESHPRWLVRDTTGQIEVPGAWGVQWEDLTKLDFRHQDLWQYMADVFLTWCRRGVDGFRCDAGYMIPVPAWTYIIARVRQQFPDTIFLLEGLGGKISVTRALLNRAGFNWAYSELFQNYDRSQIEAYLPAMFDISSQDGLLVHFAETHDNPRLAERSTTYARMRTALCALSSCQGAFGFANGVEWYATDKIDVHEASSLNWGTADNQVAWIRRLNTLLREHPAFGPHTDVRLIQQGPGNHVVALRRHRPSGEKILVVVNLDDDREATAYWNADEACPAAPLFDLLSGQTATVTRTDSTASVHLRPGAVLCLSAAPPGGGSPPPAPQDFYQVPAKITAQQLRAKTLDVFCTVRGTRDLADFDVDPAADRLKQNPLEFCRQLTPDSDEPRVIRWRWPRDRRREVMVPPEHFLLVEADTAFRATVAEQLRTIRTEASLPADDGTHFALFPPSTTPGKNRPRRLKLTLFNHNRSRHIDGPLLYLADPGALRGKQKYHRPELIRRPAVFLATNGRGAMLRARISWGELASRYDALLAANLNPDYPEDRVVLLTRCRAWIVYQGYSQEIGNDCLKHFSIDPSQRGIWHFQVPTGQGESIPLTIAVEMRQNRNAVRLTFMRPPATAADGFLPDPLPVQLILRPDIESRNFHDTTKAYLGPENSWPAATRTQPDGFVFAPEGRPELRVTQTGGRFIREPEWHYSVHRPLEAERGLDPNSDVFSPGYFTVLLKGRQQALLSAEVGGDAGEAPISPSNAVAPSSAKFDPAHTLNRALNHYLVRRGALKSVIAGYPWFLDWGRDSLIFVRGLVAAGRRAEARAVLQQFGQFEHGGTIPNMIRGQDAGNRDTSDAPLWFFTACRDLIDTEGSDAFLDESWGDRTPRQVLLAMGEALMSGTANGIRMDPDSALLYSPSHFTWMDTNHPAGTPREGYPIEIQALWYAALQFLAQIEAPPRSGRWRDAAAATKSALHRYFYMDSKGYLSDCLHASPGTPAARAQADDALRPNQLFAITLNAVDDADTGRAILAACEELLVPGAIRSLANRRVAHPLRIVHRGNLLNDPRHPYWGTYAGDEDTQRKPAYHNGTAWTWVFPSFCEAWVKVYGPQAAATARAWLASGFQHIRTGCIGHMPEILDGDYPHRTRGCDAQAWSVSEMLRVWLLLNPTGPMSFF